MRSAEHDPYTRCQVEFVATRTNDFAGTGSRENEKFERSRCRAGLLLQFSDECAQFGIGQGRMMFDLLNLGALRQQLVQMTAPTSRIVAGTVTAHCRPIQHQFN
jgi:hypothetical protein